MRRTWNQRAADSALWRKSRDTEWPENEPARLLDLAAFADGRLDPDDRERVAELLAGDPDAAGDVAAARALADRAGEIEAVPDAVVARSRALVEGRAASAGNIVAFPAWRARPALHGMARWASLAAAVLVASWLGFTLGMDTSRAFAPAGRSGDESVLNDPLDSGAGFMPDLGDGAQT